MTFKTAFHLKRHDLTRHTSQRPFKCEKCEMTFARKDKLKQHQAKHIDHPLYQCCQCGKGFYRKEHLKDHEISKHSKQYPFSCEYCNKGFVHSKDLYRHIRVRHLNAVNDGKKQRFNDENNVAVTQEATKTHSNQESGFDLNNLTDKINESVDASSTSYSLQDGLLNEQTDVTPAKHKDKKKYKRTFKCENCDSDFNSKENLKEHILERHAKGPFSCSTCKNAFSNNSEAELHVENSHFVYECTICPRQFRSLATARFHISNDHQDNTIQPMVNTTGRVIEAIGYDKSIAEINSNNDGLQLNSNNLDIQQEQHEQQEQELEQQQTQQHYQHLNPYFIYRNPLSMPNMQINNSNSNNDCGTHNSDLSLNANIVRQLVQQSTSCSHYNPVISNNIDSNLQQSHQQQQQQQQHNLNYKIFQNSNNLESFYQHPFNQNNFWNPIIQQQSLNFDLHNLNNLHNFNHQQQQHMISQATQPGIHITNNIHITQSPQQIFDVNLDNLGFSNFHYQAINYQDTHQLSKNH